MSTALHAFQHAFAHALRNRSGHDGPLARQPGFAVHRNTVMKGCIDALHANYPAVARLVGDDWFRAAAAECARAHPPNDVRLMLYAKNSAPFWRTSRRPPNCHTYPMWLGWTGAGAKRMWRLMRRCCSPPIWSLCRSRH